MSDLPTLSDLPSEQEAIAFATKLVQAYNRGELLTREEAANDPEVRRIVLDDYERTWGTIDH